MWSNPQLSLTRPIDAFDPATRETTRVHEFGVSLPDEVDPARQPLRKDSQSGVALGASFLDLPGSGYFGGQLLRAQPPPVSLDHQILDTKGESYWVLPDRKIRHWRSNIGA